MVVHGWYTCPKCHKGIQKVTGNTVLYGTPVYCRKCRREWWPTIFMGQEITGNLPEFKMKKQARAQDARAGNDPGFGVVYVFLSKTPVNTDA